MCVFTNESDVSNMQNMFPIEFVCFQYIIQHTLFPISNACLSTIQFLFPNADESSEMMFSMYVSNIQHYFSTKLFFCQYFGNYYLLLVQLGHLGGSNIYAIYDQFLMVMPNQL